MPYGDAFGESPWGDGAEQPALASTVVFYLEFGSPDSFEDRAKLQPFQTLIAPGLYPSTRVNILR